MAGPGGRVGGINQGEDVRVIVGGTFDRARQVFMPVTGLASTPATPANRLYMRYRWSHDAFVSGTISAPDYSRLPDAMRQKNAALGDVAPPTRDASQQPRFFSANNYEVEYLSEPNFIEEDVDRSPDVVSNQSVLDTLMSLQGGNLRNTPDPNTGLPLNENVSMTYYHGLEVPSNVFSGFNIWTFNRGDCIQLVDFVLQSIWGIPRDNGRRGVPK